MAHRSAQTKAGSSASSHHEELDESSSRLIDTRRLAHLLSYPSANAVRHAHRRGRLPVPLFQIAGRRGLFARIDDVNTLLQRGLQQAQPAAPSGASTTKKEVS